MLVAWLTHSLSQGDHHMYRVQAWADRCPQTLKTYLGQAVQPPHLTDDRLADGLWRLSQRDVGTRVEQRVNRQMVRAYHLTPERVRLDATTARVHAGEAEAAVLFQRGHSKDHRPDLRQLKIMLAALDRLGVLVGAEVVPGNQADDGLPAPGAQAQVYGPTLQR